MTHTLCAEATLAITHLLLLQTKKKKRGHFCVAAKLICFLVWNGIGNGDLDWKMTPATDNNHSGLELSVYPQIFTINKSSLCNEHGRLFILNAACLVIDLGYCCAGYLVLSPALIGMANLPREMRRDHMCVAAEQRRTEGWRRPDFGCATCGVGITIFSAALLQHCLFNYRSLQRWRERKERRGWGGVVEVNRRMGGG